MAAALRDRLLDHCHIVNIQGNSCRLRDRGGLAEALRQAPLGKEPRTRTDRRRRGSTVKQNSRRARIPGRSLRHRPARPSRQNPSEKPASNPRSVNFSDPFSVQFSKAIDSTQSPRKCGTFSKPIDIGVHAETGTVPALGFFTPRPYGPLCRPEVYTLRTSFSGPSGVRGTEGPYFTNLLADPPGATNRRHVFRTPTPDCASTDLGRDGTHGRRAAPSSSQYRPQRTSRRLTSPRGASLGRTTAP